MKKLKRKKSRNTASINDVSKKSYLDNMLDTSLLDMAKTCFDAVCETSDMRSIRESIFIEYLSNNIDIYRSTINVSDHELPISEVVSRILVNGIDNESESLKKDILEAIFIDILHHLVMYGYSEGFKKGLYNDIRLRSEVDTPENRARYIELLGTTFIIETCQDPDSMLFINDAVEAFV